MDINLYRQREQAERALASHARDEATRKTHLDLAESYRGVIVAYERLEALRSPGTSLQTG